MIAGGTTMTGMSGTPHFMPPEQFDPSTYGRLTTKADVWAFACVLTAMLTGGPIWPVDSQPMEIMMTVAAKRGSPEVPDAMASSRSAVASSRSASSRSGAGHHVIVVIINMTL